MSDNTNLTAALTSAQKVQCTQRHLALAAAEAASTLSLNPAAFKQTQTYQLHSPAPRPFSVHSGILHLPLLTHPLLSQQRTKPAKRHCSKSKHKPVQLHSPAPRPFSVHSGILHLPLLKQHPPSHRALVNGLATGQNAELPGDASSLHMLGMGGQTVDPSTGTPAGGDTGGKGPTGAGGLPPRPGAPGGAIGFTSTGISGIAGSCESPGGVTGLMPIGMSGSGVSPGVTPGVTTGVSLGVTTDSSGGPLSGVSAVVAGAGASVVGLSVVAVVGVSGAGAVPSVVPGVADCSGPSVGLLLVISVSVSGGVVPGVVMVLSGVGLGTASAVGVSERVLVGVGVVSSHFSAAQTNTRF
jgi:hypothetical protein